MSKEDPTGLADCDSPGGYIVHAPPPSEPGNPGAAVFAQSRPPPSAGHLPAGIAALATRAATRGATSAAARTLSAVYGLASSLASAAGSAAEDIAIGNPWVGGVVLAVIPTSTSANDTTQGCGGPCDAPGAGNQATSPEIKPEDLQGKTKEEVEQLAKDKGLVQDANKPNKYRDPNTGKERLRIDPGHIDQTTGKPYNNPNAAQPHVHGYDSSGAKIRDPDTNDPHFPLSPGQ